MGINRAHSLTLIVGVLVGLLPLGLLDSSLAVTNDFRSAQAAFERKDYDAAVRLLDTLLAAQPDHAAAYELRALAHGYMGRPEEALADHDHLVLAGKEKGDLLRRSCIGLLTHSLVQGQEKVRGAAATALAELGPADTLAALNLALHDSSPRVRTFAIQTAGRFGLAAKLPIVRDAVTDPDVTVRIATLSTLGLSNDPSVAGLVRRGLKDQDSIVQLVAREALVRLNQPELVQPFLTAARDFSPAVRGAAMGIRGRLKVKDPPALAAVTLGLSHPDAAVRAVQALGRVGGKTAIPYLRRALLDKDLTVRAFAAGHLGAAVSDRKRKGES